MTPSSSAQAQAGHDWQGHTSWCVAQGAFDLPAFLATWRAWALDPQRPGHLHVLARSPHAEFVHAACRAALDDVVDLAQQVADQSWGLLPGLHRLRFAQGRVTLTLCIGESPEFDPLLRQHPTGPCVPSADLPLEAARTVTVIGSGLAGAGTARALAERGWLVTVLDAASAPATGASGVPVGVIAPHTSHDDSTVSRLTRAGLRLMRHTLQTWLVQGVDWAPTGVLERRLPGKTRRGGVPLTWLNELADVAQDWTLPAPPPAPDDAYWHAKGAWLRPAQLVAALLDHPNICWQGHTQADRLKHVGVAWHVMQGHTVLAQSARVVIAAGPGSSALIATATSNGSNPRINPVRGQLSWGLMADLPNGTPLPPSPVNGNGAFVHGVPTEDGPAWFVGSTFDRGNDQAEVLAADHQDNHGRLAALLPDTAQALAPVFNDPTHLRAWAGIRCGTPDRFPVVGAVPHAPEGLWVNAAMGSRGLTLALLCGEILAARWQGEPLPVEAKLAKALDAARYF